MNHDFVFLHWRLIKAGIIKTFVIDVKEGKASVFHFGEEICGFSCGLFTVNEKTLPALVYATFSGLVHVYYNVCEGNYACSIFMALSLSSRYFLQNARCAADFQR